MKAVRVLQAMRVFGEDLIPFSDSDKESTSMLGSTLTLELNVITDILKRTMEQENREIPSSELDIDRELAILATEEKEELEESRKFLYTLQLTKQAIKMTRMKHEEFRRRMKERRKALNEAKNELCRNAKEKKLSVLLEKLRAKQALQKDLSVSKKTKQKNIKNISTPESANTDKAGLVKQETELFKNENIEGIIKQEKPDETEELAKELLCETPNISDDKFPITDKPLYETLDKSRPLISPIKRSRNLLSTNEYSDYDNRDRGDCSDGKKRKKGKAEVGDLTTLFKKLNTANDKP